MQRTARSDRPPRAGAKDGVPCQVPRHTRYLRSWRYATARTAKGGKLRPRCHPPAAAASARTHARTYTKSGWCVRRTRWGGGRWRKGAGHNYHPSSSGAQLGLATGSSPPGRDTNDCCPCPSPFFSPLTNRDLRARSRKEPRPARSGRASHTPRQRKGGETPAVFWSRAFRRRRCVVVVPVLVVLRA